MKNGPKRTIRLPISLTPNLSFLAGAIIGDGHLGKNMHGGHTYKILIEMTSKEILEMIRSGVENSFHIVKELRIKRHKTAIRKEVWKLEFQSKVVWLLFNKVFEIPFGKKCNKVKIPRVILKSNQECVKKFITGLFLTDGGISSYAVLFCSLSEKLMSNLHHVLHSLGIQNKVFRFENKRLNKPFFEMFIRKDNIRKFREVLPDTYIRFKERESDSLVNSVGLKRQS